MKSVYDESVVYAFYKTLAVPNIRPIALRCIGAIIFNFFLRQFHAAFLPGRAPISKVDHPLDVKIPFKPVWVSVYIDFVPFWIRMLTFFLHQYGRKAHKAVMDFMSSMGKLYIFAADIYTKNFSTTKRPFYISTPRFFTIHLLDPHLMCIPSLHVMIAIRTYTKFRHIMQTMGEEIKYAPQIEEMRQGALNISRAILYIKQHSINCISAALYAIICFEPELFTQEDAEAFAKEMFNPKKLAARADEKKQVNHVVRPENAPLNSIKADDALEIQEHIINLFRRFMSEKDDNKYWGEPLLKFLKEMPQVGKL